MPDLQACVASGGIFSLVIPPVAAVILAIELFWLLWAIIRELKRRLDVTRLRDLVIEGSLGQAILVADAKGHDDRLAICRAAIVTVQNTGSRQQAWDKLVVEAGFRYTGVRKALPQFVALAILVAIPLGLTAWSRAYAVRVAHESVASLPDAERNAAIASAQSDPAFDCPIFLGFGAAALAALPALAIAAIEGWRRSIRARDAAVKTADELAEMAGRVLDPSFRVYRDERVRRTA